VDICVTDAQAHFDPSEHATDLMKELEETLDKDVQRVTNEENGRASSSNGVPPQRQRSLSAASSFEVDEKRRRTGVGGMPPGDESPTQAALDGDARSLAGMHSNCLRIDARVRAHRLCRERIANRTPTAARCR
jgi:hypothetical protein